MGEWIVQVELNSLTRDEVVRHIEPNVMKVLLTLSAQHGKVVSKDELLSNVWPDTFAGDDVLTRCISILRRITEDDAHTPHFIQTIPKVGYRLLAPVSELAVEVQDDVSTVQGSPTPTYRTCTGSFLPSFQSAGPQGYLVDRGGRADFSLSFCNVSYQKSKTKLTEASASFRTIQFTSYAGEQIQPAFSPDGRQIAFVWIAEDAASRRIYVKTTVAGGRPKQLTFGDANDITPRSSYDDQSIYFRSNRGDRWQLWRVSAAGGDPQPVTTGDGIIPQESPDGKWLYYTRGNENGIWRVPPSGGAETQILAQPSADYWGYWQVTSRGIFYLDRSASSAAIRIFNPYTKVTSLYTLLKEVPPVYSGLAVARGGKVVLLTISTMPEDTSPLSRL
ncbi:winged helix-turn-helix domain-containing protein [Tunturiibacter gelidiferens]|uniref:winged helix-turn-helix domain-containing protein n=1 Tax=Tunturiibacter gelidiferens TaxID=3069689 RepID=UPI003D9B3E0C